MNRAELSALACEARALTHEELARELARAITALNEVRRLVSEGWYESAHATADSGINNSRIGQYV